MFYYHNPFFIFFILNEYIQNNYYYIEECIKYNVIFLSIAIIRFYSGCEIIFNRTKKTTNLIYTNVLESNPNIKEAIGFIANNVFPKKINNDVEFVSGSRTIYSTTKNILLERINDECIDMPTDFEFIVYTENHNDSNETLITYKKINTEYPFSEEIFLCEPTQYKFLLTEIIVGDKIINVNFTDNNHNYFVVGNKFTAEFISYYLNKYYQHELNTVSFSELYEFQLRVLDQDVKEETFTNKKILILNKENYEIEIKE
jgi:hypothetical protein